MSHRETFVTRSASTLWPRAAPAKTPQRDQGQIASNPHGRALCPHPGLHQAPPSPPSDGGEGWGEEVRFYWFPLSSVLSPLVPRGERMESLMQPWVLTAPRLIHLD